jgi:hypothetical protein
MNRATIGVIFTCQTLPFSAREATAGLRRTGRRILRGLPVTLWLFDTSFKVVIVMLAHQQIKGSVVNPFRPRERPM